MPHIYHYPGADNQVSYDLENRIADVDQRIEQFMESVQPFDGAVIADIGAGGGFHACRYAARAATVFAIEPDPPMVRQLYRRVAAQQVTNVSVVVADAERLPLADTLVDVVHSRFAYFFGPAGNGVHSCEPGIAEALRILKPGGMFFIVDNATTSGQFGDWVGRYAYAAGRADVLQQANDDFYVGHGFQQITIESSWVAPDRDRMRQVIAMEFPVTAVEPIMAEIEGTALSYHYRIYYRQK